MYEEVPFFCTISETFIPLLLMLEELENENVPVKLGLVVSPVMCQMLTDKFLIQRYYAWLDRQISFGDNELKRTKNIPDVLQLAKFYRSMAINNKKLFKEKYKENIPEALAKYQKKGFIELICSTATNCFLPFYQNKKEVVRAEISTALESYRKYFHTDSKGIYFSELGWDTELDQYLKEFNLKWTMIETHGALLADPPAKYGSFYPLSTNFGTNLLVKDFYAYRDIMDKETGIPFDPDFRDFYNDAVDEPPLEDIRLFVNSKGIRIPTGFKYKTIGDAENKKTVYNRSVAHAKAKLMAERFLANRVESLKNASAELAHDGDAGNKKLLSLCVWDANFLGRFWYEGPVFLKNLFMIVSKSDDIEFMTPSAYLANESSADFQKVEPAFSSSCYNGYAEPFVDANNDWAARHIYRAVDRMTELAEHLPDETGIRERCLNQAAREVLLALSSDWPRLMSEIHASSFSKWRSYSKTRLEGHLRNFTTIYEILGGNILNTKFLTDLEQRDNIFPNIKYGIFKRKD
jgi:1,4-alpha-glucan branching enzyme